MSPKAKFNKDLVPSFKYTTIGKIKDIKNKLGLNKNITKDKKPIKKNAKFLLFKLENATTKSA